MILPKVYTETFRVLAELRDIRADSLPVTFKVRLLDKFGNSIPARYLKVLPKISWSRSDNEDQQIPCDVTVLNPDDNALHASTAAVTIAGEYVVTLDGKQIGDVVTVRPGPPCASRCTVLGNTSMNTTNRTSVVRVQLRDRFNNLVSPSKQMKTDLEVAIEIAGVRQDVKSTVEVANSCLTCSFVFDHSSLYTLKV